MEQLEEMLLVLMQSKPATKKPPKYQAKPPVKTKSAMKVTKDLPAASSEEDKSPENSSSEEVASSGESSDSEAERYYVMEAQKVDDRRSPNTNRPPCPVCGSRKHDEKECWKKMVCRACDKVGHPTDRCLRVCKACKQVHDAGECKFENFFNQMRVWAESKGPGVLPSHLEKLLN